MPGTRDGRRLHQLNSVELVAKTSILIQSIQLTELSAYKAFNSINLKLQWRSAQFVAFLVVRRHISMQVSLQLMVTLSFAALSVFRWSGRGYCGPVPFGENLTTDSNIVDRKIRLYVLSLAEFSVQIIYIDAHRHH
jgi:hypothetical protein